MLGKVLDWIVGREPVATATGLAAVVTAALGVGAAFGLDVTAEQIGAVGALAAALAGWLGRSAVTPVAKRGPLPVEVVEDRRADEASRILDGHEHGGLAVGLIAFVLIVVFGAAVCVALTNEEEVEDGWAPVELADNEPCSDEGACQNRSGNCRETQQGGYCSDDDLSPSFEDSPVRDSFNFGPVCMPMATCHFDGQPQEQPA
jgi:hypothetical protein